jgi:hypothetical protein
MRSSRREIDEVCGGGWRMVGVPWGAVVRRQAVKMSVRWDKTFGGVVKIGSSIVPRALAGVEDISCFAVSRSELGLLRLRVQIGL